MWLFTPVASGTRSNAQARRRRNSSGVETDQDRVRPGIGRADRLHRQVQIDLVAACALAEAVSRREIVGIGQERQRHRHRQPDRAPDRPVAGPRSSITMASCGAPVRRRGWPAGHDRRDHAPPWSAARGATARLERDARWRLGAGRSGDASASGIGAATIGGRLLGHRSCWLGGGDARRRFWLRRRRGPARVAAAAPACACARRATAAARSAG